MRGGVWGPVGDATASPKGKGGIRKRRKVQAQQKAADAEAKAQQQLAIRRIRKGEEVRRWVMALQRTPPLSPRHHEDSDVDGLDDAEHRDEKDKTPGGRGPETVTTAAVDATIWRRQLPETRDPEEMDYCTSESIIVPPKSSSSSNSNLQQGRVRQPTASNGMTTPTDDSKHEALRRRRERDAHLFAVADGLIRGSAVATTTATATSATAAGAGTSSGGSHPHPRIELPLLGPLSFDESDGSSSDESDSGDEDSVSFLDDALTSENTGDSDDNDDEESKVVQRSATGPKEDVSSEMSMS